MNRPPDPPGTDAAPPAPVAGAGAGASPGAWYTHLVALVVDVGPEGARIRRNFSYLIADRVVRLSIALVVNVWLARYLGVERLGLMSFAQSVIVLFAVFAQLGLETILVRDLVRRPTDAPGLIGTALGIRLVGAFVTLACSFAAVLFLRHGDRLSLVMVLIFSTMAFSQVFDVIEHWFQSRSTLGPLVVARTSASLVAAAAKVIAILMHASLPVIAGVLAGEAALSSLALVVAYRLRAEAPRAWRFHRAELAELLRASWPLFLNSVAIVISVRVDQMILTSMHGPRANGIYAASQRLTEVIYYIPVAVLAAANPALLRTHHEDPVAYERRLQRLFSALALGGVAIAIGVSVLSGPIIRILFGAAYAEAAPVLAIQVWTAPMLFLGVAQTNWFIANGRQTGLLVRSAVAAALSLVLNFMLVPAWGPRGAAITMLVSQTVAQVLLNACFAETRPLFRMHMRAFLPVGRR